MDHQTAILQQAEQICEVLFGLMYHSLEVNSWPRIASYYCAKRMIEGDASIFTSLSEIAAAVHKFNRNVISSQAFRDDETAAHEICRQGVTRFEGGSRFERITGQPPPEGFAYQAGPDPEGQHFSRDDPLDDLAD